MSRKLRFVAALTSAFITALALAGCELGSTAPVGQAFEGAKSNPASLRAFLNSFPKGADLHNLLAGGVYAEDLIRIGATQRQCFRLGDRSIAPPPCGPGEIPLANALVDRQFRDRVIDSVSLRHFVPAQSPAADSNYAQFYAAQTRSAATTQAPNAGAQLLTGALAVAVRDSTGYVEFGVSPGSDAVSDVATRIRRPLNVLRQYQLLQRRGLLRVARQVSRETRQTDAQFARANRCGKSNASPVCNVQTSLLYSVDRDQPPDRVFAELSLGYLLARTSPRYVGVSLNGAENGPYALRDYDLHMEMIRGLDALGSPVPTALSAGALTEAFVQPQVLGTHIEKAVAAGADRVGHATDLAYVSDPDGLVRQLRDSGVAVEALLSLDASVLGRRSDDHPVGQYLSGDAPVVLASGSQGILRTDLTAQYQLAVAALDLSYDDLVQLSRNSLQMSFLPGSSLWQGEPGLGVVKECSGELVAAEALTSPATTNIESATAGVRAECVNFLRFSPKAAAQFRLEQRLLAFAASAPTEFTARPASPRTQGP